MKIDFNKLWSFINKHIYFIIFFTMTILSLIIRLSLIEYTSGDYTNFLKPWFDNLVENGGIYGIANDISNYNAPYITIMALLTYIPISSLSSIKLVSIVFDYICAYAVYEIVFFIFDKNKKKELLALLAYIATIILPTVFLNSAFWSQCDSIYTAFVLWSIFYLMKKKYLKSFIFLGIAFSFKLQAIFILPLYVLIYLSNREFSIFNFLLIPIMNIVMGIPSMIFGKSFIDLFKVYIEQTDTYSEFITLNIPNFYSIFFNSYNSNLINTPHESFIKIGVVFTLSLFVIIAFLVYLKKIRFDAQAIIEFGLWSVLICVFFLPEMHDRYLFMADVFSIIYLFFNKNKYYIPIAIEFISLNGYLYFLFGSFTINLSNLSIFYFIILIIYSKNMCKKYFCS